MAWEECVTSIRANLDPNAKEVNQVTWTGPNAQVTEDNLETDSFSASKPFALICPDRHCQDYGDFSPQAHALCNCKDVNGNPIPDCVPKNVLYPYPSGVCLNIDNTSDYSTKRGRACTKQGDSYYALTCFCCCSCYANGTKIAIPTGFKTIEYFQTGDEVLTASLATGSLKWNTGKVAYSMGTGPDGHQSAMVYMHFGEDDRQIIVTPDQLFLMSTGKLKRSDRLVPGVDELVNEWGEAVPIHEISIGEYIGGVHHISTAAAFDGVIDGHLLLSEGVVSGDFTLQANSVHLIDMGVMEDHRELPKIGSEDYENKYSQLSKEYYGVMHITALSDGKREKVQRPQKFYLHGERSINVPNTAAAYLDNAQAEDVYNNAPRWSFEDIGMNSSLIRYVLRLFRGFFPDINFYYDQSNVTPNAYAFVLMDMQYVVLTGGLTRLKGMDQEGLSFVLAHMISTLQKSNPTGANGWTSVAMADYYSIGFLMDVYFGKNFGTMYNPGIKQLDTSLFKYISPENQAYTNDPYQPTVDTRFDALDAGKAMDFPPDGIGGPTAGGLKVVDVKAFPPMVGAFSFVNQDIDEAASEDAFHLLVQNKVVTVDGEVSPDFTVNTDLNFLFPQVSDTNQRSMMIEQVRSSLVHAMGLIQLEFNDLVNPASASSYHDFTIDPDARIDSVVPKTNIPVVEIAAEIKRGVEYTLTSSTNVRSYNGSTIDLQQRSIAFKI
ncbi:Hint domain-containing protein [Chryseobacterium fluminis]|uniref:Hint domain-containing protein n=1 Tax=Chryseobacterium fluminis TaxID=2983606 RepID=UPI002257741F|nr:Hint domain-containing protein [Chryseobacterium sp. MMS21-Ot14]UZT98059.1 Hint domain-containing protein [Chryseobacterium sp. MMS21-Ot14]